MHALLECGGHAPLRDLRETFLAVVMREDHNLALVSALNNSVGLLRATLASRTAVTTFAKYVFDVLAISDQHSVVVPEGYRL